MGSIPGLGRVPEEGRGNLLQYCCLENPLDRGTWLATVHTVAKSQTWLKRLSTHALAPEGKSKCCTLLVLHHSLHKVAMSKAGGQSLGLFQRMQVLRLMPFEPMVSTLSLTIFWRAKFNEGMLDKKRMLFGRSWTHHKSQDTEEWSWGWDTVKSPGALLFQVWSPDQQHRHQLQAC